MTSYSVKTRIPSKEWVIALEQQNHLLSQSEQSPSRQHLKNKLKPTGGFAAIIDDSDKALNTILSRGEFIQPEGAKYVAGFPNQCHYNSATYWNNNSGICCLMTGYALSDDGMWRQHSWCLLQRDPRSEEDIDDTVVETTADRLLYYGIRLTKEESESFLKWNQ